MAMISIADVTRSAAAMGRCLAASLVAVSLLVAVQGAQAGVTLESTRVIYPLREREVTVQLDNRGDTPSLIQVWIDGGNAASVPSTAGVPFLVTPPIFRIGGGQSKSLRIVYAGDSAMPKDRESVYWLNVLDVPPEAKEPAPNQLALAFRTRIKIFVRPDGLDGVAKDAPAKLRWRLVEATDGKGQALRVTNPTPFHVSFRSFEVQAGSKVFTNERGALVAPAGDTVLSVPDLAGIGAGESAVVRFVAIDDDAAPLPGQSPLDASR